MTEPGECKEEETMSESNERAWELNNKIQADNIMAHVNRINALAEVQVANAINQSNITNLAASEQTLAVQKAALTHTQNMNIQMAENNRFTMDRLYGMFPEEAAGTATLLQIVIGALKANPGNLAAQLQTIIDALTPAD